MILSFQAAVQATSLQEQYEQHMNNKDMNSAKSIAEKIKKLEASGISPATNIVEDHNDASNLAEEYTYFIDKKTPIAIQNCEKKLARLKDLRISPATKIVEDVNRASTLEEKYVYCILNEKLTMRAAKIAAKIEALKKLEISQATKIPKELYLSSTLAEKYVYYLEDDENPAAERVAKEIQDRNSEKNLKQPQKKEERPLFSEELSNPAKIAVHTEEEAEKRLHALLSEIEETTKTLTTIQKNVQINLELKKQIQAEQKNLDTLTNRFNNLTEQICHREKELNALDGIIDIKRQALRRANEEKLGPDAFKTMKAGAKRDER